jgi:hypothetical protein
MRFATPRGIAMCPSLSSLRWGWTQGRGRRRAWCRSAWCSGRRAPDWHDLLACDFAHALNDPLLDRYANGSRTLEPLGVLIWIQFEGHWDGDRDQGRVVATVVLHADGIGRKLLRLPIFSAPKKPGARLGNMNAQSSSTRDTTISVVDERAIGVEQEASPTTPKVLGDLLLLLGRAPSNEW